METVTEARHIFRSLLRAVTYLPDSFVRSYMHNHIIHRFRLDQEKRRHTVYEYVLPWRAPDKDLRAIQQRIHKARQSLRTLERAANGSLEDLQKVFLLAYGRKGKRKRELIQDLLLPDESSLPKDATALGEFMSNAAAPAGNRRSIAPPDSKFSIFVRSQSQNHPSSAVTAKIRETRPKIPEENIWGRRLPVKLRASMEKKWWAETLRKLLPPIPQNEWNRLQDLATGKIPLEKTPPRRAAAAPEPLAWRENDVKVLEYIKFPTKFHWTDVEKVIFDPSRGLTVSQNTEDIDGKTRHLTNRMRRRFYADIWNLTSTMSQDEATKKWKVQWGGEKSQTFAGVISIPSSRDVELFEGLGTIEEAKLKRGTRDNSRPKRERMYA
jgi:hypothetical protein